MLMRKGDAHVFQKQHFRSEDAIRLLIGASRLVPPMKYAHRELFSLLMAFRTTLPSRVEQALCVAVLRLQEFTESVKRLDAETVDKMTERDFDVQLTQNAQLTASAFEALSELMKIVHEAKQRLGTR